MSVFNIFSRLFESRAPAVSPALVRNITPVVSENDVVVEDKMTSNVINPLDLMKVTYRESPNKSDRKDSVRAIVLHHTGPGAFNGIVEWLCNPEAKASAHYVLGYKGELTQLVNTKRSAWHAGKSTFLIDGAVRNDLNNSTIGIEICNPGVLQKGEDNKFYYEAGRVVKEWKGATPVEGQITFPSGNVLKGYYVPYPEEQLNKLISLCKALVIKYPNIGREDIITHYDIATPEGRKNDPFGLNIEDIKNKIFK